MRTKSVVALGCVALTLFLLVLPGPRASAAEPAAAISPGYLRCEYQVNPPAVDAPAPRLSLCLLNCKRLHPVLRVPELRGIGLVPVGPDKDDQASFDLKEGFFKKVIQSSSVQTGTARCRSRI